MDTVNNKPVAQLFQLTLLIALMLSSTLAAAKSIEGNILQNSGFERPGDGVPQQWLIEDRVKHKGKVTVISGGGGGRMLRLQPNRGNVAAELDSHPLGIGQAFSLEEYPGLRGKSLHLSARLGAQGKTAARIRLIGIRSDGQFIGISLQQDNSNGELLEQSARLAIPDDSKTLYVVIGLDTTGTSGTALFDDLYLGVTPKPSAAAAQSADPRKQLTASISVNAARPLRTIPDTLYGMNIEWAWDGNGLWDSNNNRLNQNLVQLTREIRPTTFRYPGGIFADFYRWKDGIGPRGKRPTTAHYIEGPVSRHNIGTDEALEFARLTGGELMITVNIATGTVEEAVEWLRYINRPEQTSGQQPRARYWEIGNENYYHSGTAYVNQAAHNADEYSKRVLEFGWALKKADPRISIIAIAEENYMRDFEPVHPDWLRLLLTRAADVIDYIAIHNGYVPGLARDYDLDVRTIYRAMLAAPLQLRESLDRVTAQIRKHAPAHASRIKLAITEWSPSFQITIDGPYLDHPKTLGSALFVASNLKNYIEHPDVEIANYFKLNDYLWAGILGARDGKFTATAPYHAFRLYRHHFGQVLIETGSRSPTFDTDGAGYVGSHRNVPYLDVIGSLSEDGRRLHLMVINKHFDQDISARIDIAGFEPRARGMATVLTGTGIDANTGTELFKAPGVKWAVQKTDPKNPRFDKGAPGEVTVTSQEIEVGKSFDHRFKKHSVTALELDLSGS